MFLGKFPAQISPQHQIDLPAPFHELIAEGAYITQGFERTLMLLQSETFLTVVQHAKSFNITDPLVRLMFRLIMANAHQVPPDTTGVLEIPATLAEFAGINGEVVVVGQGDYIEIWSPEAWLEQEAMLRDSRTNSSRFAHLELTQV
jgi:transcriptional regulator MraZ